MLKQFAAVGVCLLAPLVVRAQDGLIKDFSATHVEKFIKDVIKADVKAQEMPKQFLIFYDTPDGQFDIYLRTGPKKAIFFRYPHQTLKKTQQEMDVWNSGLHHVYAFAGKDGKIVLQASLNLESGLSMGQLTDFYDQIQRERILFEGMAK